MTWANQTRILGQNFERLGAAIGNGLIAWIRPAVVAINSYMDSIIAAVQRVVNALGQIFGWQMIVDTTGASLVDDTLELSDAYDDATGAAKKLKQQLLGIDELNNLTTKDNGSGSGGAGLLGGFGGGNIIEPGGISFVPFESDIKDLETLGKRISEALRNLLPDDWSEIYEKARGFGTGFSDFLNGLIQPDTFYKLGQSVAGILNTISEAIIAFLTGANWEQYKDSFIAFWNGLTDEINVSTVELIISAIVIKKVGKWILGGAALKALSGKISAALAGVTGAGASIETWKIISAGKTFGTYFLVGLGSAIGGFTFGEWATKKLMGDNAPEMTGIEIAAELASGIMKGDIWAALGEWWKDLWDGVKAVCEDSLKAIDKWGVDTATSIVNTKNEWAQAIADWWVNDVEVWFTFERWRELGNSIKSGIASGWNNMVSWWKTTGFYSWWQDVKKNFSEEEWTFSGIMKGLGKSFIDAVEAIKEIMNGFFDWLSGKKNSWSEGGLAFKGSSMPTGDFSKVRKYASGGFPEQGSLFLAGETYGQSEWVGDVNGRTGVVSGNEITGIADAIYQTSAQEMELLRQQNQYLIGILNKEFGISTNQIGKAAREYAQDYSIRNHGRQAYQF